MKKAKKNYYGIILISLFVIFGFMEFPMQAQAIEPKMTDILITNNAENVLLYARLVNGFKPDTELAILAGIPATFTLQLEVHQVRYFVWDKKITSHEIKRTIKYDNLKKTFSVYTNGNPQPVIFSDFESAQKSMADFNGIIAVPLACPCIWKMSFSSFLIGILKQPGSGRIFPINFCFPKIMN
jgi:hypothetical protein